MGHTTKIIMCFIVFQIMESRGWKFILMRIIIILQIQLSNGVLQNVALGKSTSQASPWKYASRLAVDGNKNRHLVGGLSCTETLDVINPWWEVDLGEIYHIDHLKVHNRADCCAQRLSDVLFEVSTDQMKYEFFYYRPGTVGQIETMYPNDTKIGRWVKVSLSRTARLTLCEFEVMSQRKVESKNMFAVQQFKRGTGAVIQCDLVNSLLECMFLCFKNDDCFSVNVVQHALHMPYIGCQMMYSLINESNEDLNTTLIQLNTIEFD